MNSTWMRPIATGGKASTTTRSTGQNAAIHASGNRWWVKRMIVAAGHENHFVSTKNTPALAADMFTYRYRTKAAQTRLNKTVVAITACQGSQMRSGGTSGCERKTGHRPHSTARSQHQRR